MAKKSKTKKPVKAKSKKPVKKVAAKKPIKKAAAKKPAPKKVVKKAVAKKVAPKIKAQPKKSITKKAVASKPSVAIKAASTKSRSNVIDMPTKFAKKQGLTKKVQLPAGYKPNKTEDYMNPLQLEYFRQKLELWKKELLAESTETIQHLQAESWNEPDPSDQATIVEQTGLELRTRDRYRKLINKIDSALQRIEQGEYGYCEVTGDPIGLARLEARPIATMTIAAQEQHEMEEKLHLEG
jgi:DnaK suppressor protein